MPLVPLVSAGIEGGLNRFLWQDDALKPARQRLFGKVLRIEIKELTTPLVLAFSEQQIDVLSQWEGVADCTVITHFRALFALRDRKQLTALIRQGALEVQGTLAVVQNFSTLVDLAEFDLAELIAPYLGDIAAESLSQTLRSGRQFLVKKFTRSQHYLSEALVEEWRLAPGELEVAWFTEEIVALERAVDTLSQRLTKLEKA